MIITEFVRTCTYVNIEDCFSGIDVTIEMLLVLYLIELRWNVKLFYETRIVIYIEIFDGGDRLLSRIRDSLYVGVAVLIHKVLECGRFKIHKLVIMILSIGPPQEDP